MPRAKRGYKARRRRNRILYGQVDPDSTDQESRHGRTDELEDIHDGLVHRHRAHDLLAANHLGHDSLPGRGPEGEDDAEEE